MRTFNVELNIAKLNTKKVQLSQIEARLAELDAKYKATYSQFEKKALEVSQLEAAIKLVQTTPSVS